MTIFRNPHDPDNKIIIEKIAEWVREKFNISGGIAIHVKEMDCADPHCVDMETVVSLIEEGKIIKTIRVHKPIVYVRKWDIDQIKI